MKILLADDDPVSRTLTESTLTGLGFEVVTAPDGNEAWELLQQPGAPRLVVVDWMMPGLDGLDVCRRLRAKPETQGTWVLVLTARAGVREVAEALEAGANDYVAKPFHPAELAAGVQAGARILQLQIDLERRVKELEQAQAHVTRLQGLLPICSYCKRIRDDKAYWHQVDVHISEHSTLTFTHGVCPQCYERVVKPQIETFRRERDGA
ncbi:MAG: response regulator transcription factor [Acidobacteria bacterium]|nr:response regulator transcription factor [Acidobacteriota bacterium]